jgi:ribonuclease HI
MNIRIFTDGSFVKKGNICKASYGYYMTINDKEYEDYRLLDGEKTNNKAEINGIILALEILNEFIQLDDKVKIYSDSEYTIKSLTEWIINWKKNGWKTANNKPVKNIELIKKMDELYNKLKSKCNNIEIKHIMAHQKEPQRDSENWILWNGNNRVDCELRKITIF